MIDYLCFSAEMDGRMIEHAGHLHEHFVDPVAASRGRASTVKRGRSCLSSRSTTRAASLWRRAHR
jgi:hypothetical protein